MKPTLLQGKAINQLQINDMDIKKTRMQACGLIYWIKMNAYIEEAIKSCPYVLIIRPHDPKTKKYHTKHQGGYGNVLELTSLQSLQLITSIIFLLSITIANSQL